MIIDSHVHLGFNDLLRASAADLIRSMDGAGVDKAVVFASALFDAPVERCLAECAPYRDRLAVLGFVSPLAADRPDLATVRRWLTRDGVCGLKFYLGYEPFYPADACARPYLELLAELGKPAVFHTGDTWTPLGNARLKYAHPLGIDDLAVDMPNLKIVMAHLGNPWIADGQDVTYKNKSVYADCSGHVDGRFSPRAEKYFLEAVDRYALDEESGRKLLFGSDWPICKQEDYVAVAAKAPLLDPEAFWHGNAEKLFGLRQTY